ncbi:helix-turn-helix transcriptional regulator [Plantibacter sp. YIM 135347]|uniref:helix-turn-helix transcriptional regulator n=1 Tax=Plantibacter sp. YIM 135347 TaxID=3423919 RepID=UPI003D333E80
MGGEQRDHGPMEVRRAGSIIDAARAAIRLAAEDNPREVDKALGLLDEADEIAKSLDAGAEFRADRDALLEQTCRVRLSLFGLVQGDAQAAQRAITALVASLAMPNPVLETELRAEQFALAGEHGRAFPLLRDLALEVRPGTWMESDAAYLGILGLRGERSEALAVFRRAARARLAQRRIAVDSLIELGAAVVTTELLSGRPTRAALLVTSGSALLRATPASLERRVGALSFASGMIDVASGRWSGATDRFEHAIASMPTGDLLDGHAQASAYLSYSASVQGDASAASVLRERAIGSLGAGNRTYAGYTRYLCALSALWSKLDDVAAEDAADLRAEAEREDLPLLEVYAIHLLSMSGESTPSLARRAADLVDRCDAPIAEPLLYQIESGRNAPSTRALSRHGLWIPAHGASLADLSTREREIAFLAALGFSTAEIATRLYISGRTVDTHLGKVFTKTGTRSREELAKLLHDVEY